MNHVLSIVTSFTGSSPLNILSLPSSIAIRSKMPSAKDVNQYRRGFARVLDLPFNRQELTINPAVRLVQ